MVHEESSFGFHQSEVGLSNLVVYVFKKLYPIWYILASWST